MAKVRLRDTQPEMQLRRRLYALGLRYRTCRTGLPGRPDIHFGPARVAVFVDGDFWHGRDFENRLRKGQFKVRRACWVHKIRTNMARDIRNNRELRALGYRVVRVWASDLKKREGAIAARIARIVNERSQRLES